VIHPLQQALRVGQEAGPSFGQTHRAGCAIKQFDRQDGLKLVYGLAGGGLTQMQGERGISKTAPPRDLDKDPQVFQVRIDHDVAAEHSSFED